MTGRSTCTSGSSPGPHGSRNARLARGRVGRDAAAGPRGRAGGPTSTRWPASWPRTTARRSSSSRRPVVEEAPAPSRTAGSLVDNGFRAVFVVGALWLSGSMEAVSAAAIEVEDLDDAALLAAASEAERLDREVQLTQAAHRLPVVRAHPATVRVGYGDLGRRRSARAGVTATPPSAATAPRRWLRSWPRSSVPRWASRPSRRCH